VNLIVGKNNSGKSTVLEALRIYAGNANQQLLENIAASHDEKFRFNNEDIGRSSTFFPFEDLFIGRHFPQDEDIEIVIGESVRNKKTLFIKHVFFIDKTITAPQLSFNAPTSYPEIISKLKIEGLDIPPKQALWVRREESDLSFLIRLENNSFPYLPYSYPSEGFVPTQFISANDLAREWDQVVLSEHEEIIKQAMQIVLPEFEKLAFIGEQMNRSAKVKLTNFSRPIPLKSLGDGMMRVLQLALKLVSARGFLLIDEFENGLHYSIQEKIWTLLFKMAEKLDIQVFATTHSWDCIESFTKVAIENETTEGVLFRMGRSAKTSNKGQIIATVYDKERLYNITQADIEVR
jgi:AAA15 family ATPase/GTPase